MSHRAMESFILFLVLVICSFTSTGRATTALSPRNICPVVLPPGSGAVPNPPAGFGSKKIINGISPTGDLQSHLVTISPTTGEVPYGGTLLSEFWVLTYGACAVVPGRDVVRVGGDTISEGTEVGIAESFVHPEYDEDTARNDVQVIRLAKAAPEGSKFVLLSSESNIPAEFAFIRTAGYGETLGTTETLPGQLLQVDVPVQLIGKCSEWLQNLGIDITFDTHVCAGYDRGGCDSCVGDGGGPMYLFDENDNIVQVGIASFGRGCAMTQSPCGYTRVSSYGQWMQEVGAVFTTSTHGQNVYHAVVATPEPLLPTGPSFEPMPESPDDLPNPTPADDLSPSTEPEPDFDAPSCFSAHATVDLEDGTTKTMENLTIGDRVRVGPEQFSEVFLFTHRVKTGMRNFMYLYSSASNTPLILSPGHFLLINGRMTPAKESRVGDVLDLASGATANITRVFFW